MSINSRDALESRVLACVCEWTGCAHVTLDSNVSEELGNSGIDACRLIEHFSRDFAVDLTSFVFDRHFYTEQSVGVLQFALLPYLALVAWALTFLKDWLPDPSGTREAIIAPVYVRDLVAAARSHRWPAALAVERCEFAAIERTKADGSSNRMTAVPFI
jgi:hypothetical protein